MYSILALRWHERAVVNERQDAKYLEAERAALR